MPRPPAAPVTSTTPRMPAAPRASTSLVALAADVVAVLVFTAVGRRSHAEGSALAGLAHTAWPFLAALALAWLLVLARRWRPTAVRPAGTTVWLVTVLAGHALRLVSGQGSAWSFLVVTAVVLAVFLLGWRALVGRTSRSVHGPRGQD